ncbi:hypothetical protein R1sor_009093 [Riccia sorocarpa]|uniref:Uncharacterized protein n=1 Tax=Riccia sorocarpa TaxID=122646 RepID=A0ABD3H7L1_9MARC
MTRILSGDDSEWASAVKFFLKENVARGRGCRMRRFWSLADIMLLHPNLQFKYSKTTKILMEAWRSATKVLRFGGPVLFIPAVLDMEQLFTLLSKYTEWGALCHPQARSWFRKMGVNCLMQLKSAAGNWTSLQQLAALKNLLPTRELLEYLDSFQLFLIRVNTDVPKLEDSPSWYWDATSSKITGSEIISPRMDEALAASRHYIDKLLMSSLVSMVAAKVYSIKHLSVFGQVKRIVLEVDQTTATCRHGCERTMGEDEILREKTITQERNCKRRAKGSSGSPSSPRMQQRTFGRKNPAPSPPATRCNRSCPFCPTWSGLHALEGGSKMHMRSASKKS